MGLYQRRRPSPIKIVPNHVLRQDPAASVAPSDSPDSPDTPGPESPDSPSPTASSFPASQPPPPKTDAPAQVSSSAPPAAATSEASKAPPPPPPPPPAPSSTKAQEQASSSAAPSVATSSAQVASSAPPPPAATSKASSQSSQGSSAPAAQITSGSSAAASSAQGDATTAIPDSQFSTQRNRPTPEPSNPTVTITSSASNPAQSELVGQPQRSTKQDGAIMSKGAEAALITFAVLGFVALLVGVYIFLKRRRRRRNELGMRHAEDAFDPSNSGSLHAPETAHFAAFASPEPHMTKSSTSSNDIFGGSHYQRPETVSTDENRSRIVPPQPTPNPFADPPLNKAYDVLRGRPRSTTLTDRGSWIRNPFKDPESERFDPFGEMQEKARMERVKYMEDARRADTDRRMREREQQFLEKERMGLGLPEQGRKGSGVTVEGLGVLDRSGSGQYR